MATAGCVKRPFAMVSQRPVVVRIMALLVTLPRVTTAVNVVFHLINRRVIYYIFQTNGNQRHLGMRPYIFFSRCNTCNRSILDNPIVGCTHHFFHHIDICDKFLRVKQNGCSTNTAPNGLSMGPVTLMEIIEVSNWRIVHCCLRVAHTHLHTTIYHFGNRILAALQDTRQTLRNSIRVEYS